MCTFGIILEFWGILLLRFGYERLVRLRQSSSDTLGEAKTYLLLQCTNHECLLWMHCRQIHVIDPTLDQPLLNARRANDSFLPLCPFPGEAEIAQMMREPVHKSVLKFQIHRINASVQVANGSAQTRGNSRRGNLTGLSQYRVVVD